jgi:hypothetical protein
MDDHDDELSSAKYEFVVWLKKNNLHSYQTALEEEGYEDLISIVLLNEDEIEELATAISMRPGHRKKLPVVINMVRKEMKEKTEREEEEQKEKYKREKEQEEERHKRERAKREREENVAEKLASIEDEEKLAKAKAKQAKAQSVNESSGDGGSLTKKDAKTEPIESTEISADRWEMPADKEFFSFLSHKKNNSKLGSNTEMLAIRVSFTSAPSLSHSDLHSPRRSRIIWKKEI